MSNSQGFTFQIYKANELVAQMRSNLGLEITEDKINNPTPEGVLPVYEAIYTEITGTSKQDLHQPQFDAVFISDHLELHEESFPNIDFAHGLCELLKKAGVKDFSKIRDLYAPEKNRFKRNLSALLNFYYFHSERLRVASQCQQQLTELNSQLQLKEEEFAKLVARVNQLRAQRKQEEPEVMRLDAESRKLEKELMELNGRREQYEVAIKDFQDKAFAAQEKINSTKFQIYNEKQEASKFKSQVVQSPQKMKKKTVDMKVAVESEKVSITETEKRTHELQSKLEVVSRIEKEVGKGVKAAEETEVEMKKRKETRAQVKQTKSRFQQTEEVLKELNTQDQHIQRQVRTLQGKIEHLKVEEENKVTLMEQLKNEALQEKLDAERKKQAALEVVGQQNEGLARLHKQMEDEKRSHENEMSNLKELYDKLEEKIHDYHKQVFQVMKTI